MALSLGQIVESLGGRLIGDPQHLIQKLAPLDTAQADALSFLSNPKYQSQLATTQAGCVIVSPAVAETAKVGTTLIVADNPYHYFARLTQLWRQHTRVNDEPLVHPSAVIHPQAHVDASARIGPLCVIERGASIGANTWLKSGITVGEDCRIGERCIVHAGVVIGADGFGFALFEGRWEKIEQLGAVRIDSGDLGVEVTRVRALLDSLGNTNTKITVTNDLDEYSIAALAAAPVDNYGVGTSVVTGSGIPTAGFVYKLVAFENADGSWRSVAKRSVHKTNVGGRKFAMRRHDEKGTATAELLSAGHSSEVGSNDRELLVPLITNGEIHTEYTGPAGTLLAREFHAEAKKALPLQGLRLGRGDAALPTKFI